MSTLREQILSVYRGETPDVVPYMLDLSHWFYHRNQLPWDLSKCYDRPETELIDYHKRMGVGFYLPNLGSFFTASYPPDVLARTMAREIDGTREITWSLETARGRIARTRVWHPGTYSWHIKEWGVRTEDELRVLADAMSGIQYAPRWDRYQAWVDAVGDCGIVYLPVGYSGMGQLLNYWMGVERALLAQYAWAGTVRETVERINANLLTLIDLVAASPAEVIIMGDNFSSDIQPPWFFEQWSRAYYAEAARRLHQAGKFVAVHIDGRLRGAISMIHDAGVDCGDAITPQPTGDLSMEECREEAGPHFILSGGIAPVLWLPHYSDGEFRAHVIRWLELKRRSPRLIANAGDQVPPGAVEHRIEMMRDLVEEYGRY